MIPVWWSIYTILTITGRGLDRLRLELLGDDGEQHEFYARVRDTGGDWIVVAADWSLQRADAPSWVRDGAPEVIRFLAPLADQPLADGIEPLRTTAIERLRRWRKWLVTANMIWTILMIGPLWIGPLVVSLVFAP